jgi:hypothetical protein
LHATHGYWIKAGPGWIGFGQSVPPRLGNTALELVFVIVGVEDIFRGGHHALIASGQLEIEDTQAYPAHISPFHGTLAANHG